MSQPLSPSEAFALAQLQAKMFADAKPPAVEVGRYVLQAKLGEGGYGEVFRAFDPQIQRDVALKLMNGDDAENASQRLVREAKAIAALRHPNIVEFYEFGHTQNIQFVAMEFIDGQTLAEWATPSRAWPEVLDVFIPAGEALAFAHSKGIVHRDFKPTNVMINCNGVVKVLDFGLVRRAAGWTSGSGLTDPLTAPGTAVGTPAYMAPEQHMGAATTAAADQYAFCATLFHLLYGRAPFDASNPLLMARAKYRQRFVEVDRARAPAYLYEVITRGMQTRPDLRWPDMQALLTALQRAPHRNRWIATAAVSGVVAVAGLGIAAWMLLA